MRPICFAVLTALALPAAAQDPLLQDIEQQQESETSPWTWYGDGLLRYDHVDGLENRDALERGRLRLRTGMQYDDGEQWIFRVAIEGAQGTDDNRDNRRNLDNERSDGGGLDELSIRLQATDSLALQAGKAPLPLALTPLTWDADLRPIGASVQISRPVGDFDRISFVAGAFDGDLAYDEDSRLAGAQLGWHWREGAPFSAEVLVGYVEFDDLDAFPRQSISRTNRVVAGRLLSDYELLDVQFGARWDLDGTPLDARIDFVENLGADDQNRGTRAHLIYGTSAIPHGWEFGLSAQRIQRDASLAAYTEDEWWFHSFAHGVMPWVAYGFDATWSTRVAWFHERRDNAEDYVDRVVVDLRAVW